MDPGILNSGAFTLAAAATYDVILAGTTLGSGYNQLNVTGGGNLAGATLVLPGTVPSAFATLPAGTALVLINTTTGFAGSTFSNMAEGGAHSFGPNETFRFTYLGGADGQDFAAIRVQDTTTTLTSSLNPSDLGQSVTFTATVTGGDALTPTGPVEFFDGATMIGPGTLAAGIGASTTATFSTAALAAGTHAITAEYMGDSESGTSTSTALSQVVNPATTRRQVVTSSINPSKFGQLVTFTDTVTPVAARHGNARGHR